MRVLCLYYDGTEEKAIIKDFKNEVDLDALALENFDLTDDEHLMTAVVNLPNDFRPDIYSDGLEIGVEFQQE